MHARDGSTVAGDADEPNETLVARLEHGLERAAFTKRLLPFDDVDEVVQLDQVDPIDTHALERASNLRPCALVIASPGLRREKEAVAMLGEPGLQAILRLAVRGGDVDVVDALLQQQLEDGLRLGLRHAPADRGRPEDRSRALVACRAEGRGRYHDLRLPQLAGVPFNERYSPPLSRAARSSGRPSALSSACVASMS